MRIPITKTALSSIPAKRERYMTAFWEPLP